MCYPYDSLDIATCYADSGRIAPEDRFHKVMTPHQARVVVTQATIREMRSSEDHQGYIALRLHILDGPYQGRNVYYSYFPHIVAVRIKAASIGLPTTEATVPNAVGMKFLATIVVRDLSPFTWRDNSRYEMNDVSRLDPYA